MAGIPVALTRSVHEAQEVEPVARPDHIESAGSTSDEIVVRPADLARMVAGNFQ